MNQTTLLLKLPYDCETAMSIVTTLLRNEGLSLRCTFDLRSACASPGDPTCPHHGDRPCDCQLVILLVYDRNLPPAALIGHGSDEHTEICLDDPPDQRQHPELTYWIHQALRVGI